jgi:uncharacterized protein (TIGR02001 family)
MKLTQGIAALVLLTSAAAAHAEFSGTLTATTDYDWRGVTQSAQDPALQGSLDYAADIGFYAGAWASNVDFGNGDPNIEIDLYAGWGGGDEVTWDAGIIYYTYPGESSFNFPEIYGSLGWEWLSGKISYSWDFAGTSETAFYYEANVEYPLPHDFKLLGHIGYSDGDGIEAAYGQDNYTDWAAGLGYTWSHFDFALKWVDGSDLKTLDGTPHDIASSEARVIFTVSTSFPWSEAEPVEGESEAKDAAQ